jgi:Phosphodiester glycosidase
VLSHSSRSVPLRRAVLVSAVAFVVTGLAAVVPGSANPARAGSPSLPLGDPDLVETRTVETLAPGVTLTRIERGTTPAEPDQILTTSRGPWRVNVLTIERATARGHLRTTYGPDLSRTNPVTEMVGLSKALAGVNASFFAVGAQFPGDPVGLGVYGGRMLSNPATTTIAPNEADLLIDARTNRVSYGPHTWSGTLTNRRTGRVQRLEFVNHPPVVPVGCRSMADQTRCTRAGDVSLFTPAFGASTPSGPGVEVVLDGSGCVVRTTRARGTALAAGQTSVQATGQDTSSLLRVRTGGCLARSVRLFGSGGQRISLDRWVFGVSGRYRLAAGGRITVPTGPGPFYDRNPRTIVGTTGTGQILIVTVDGRQPASVGTTMEETAALVGSLGLRDAVNLDGGSSTTMSVRGALVNRPSGDTEHPVGDALVYVDTPFH